MMLLVRQQEGKKVKPGPEIPKKSFAN